PETGARNPPRKSRNAGNWRTRDWGTRAEKLCGCEQVGTTTRAADAAVHASAPASLSARGLIIRQTFHSCRHRLRAVDYRLNPAVEGGTALGGGAGGRWRRGSRLLTGLRG